MASAVAHYNTARNAIGYPPPAEVFAMLPRIYSWIYMGLHNWIYNRQAYMRPFRSLFMDQEHRLGIGLITTGLVLLGLYRAKARKDLRIYSSVAVVLLVLVTVWPPGFSLWTIVASLIPAAGAIRAAGRAGLLLLLPASIGLSFVLDLLRKKSFLFNRSSIGGVHFGTGEFDPLVQQSRNQESRRDCSRRSTSGLRRVSIHAQPNHIAATGKAAEQDHQEPNRRHVGADRYWNSNGERL
jgi:hypothetical protein